MKRYQDYNKRDKTSDLNEKELRKVRWTKFTIVVPTNHDKKELMDAFRHIHDSDIDTDFVTVNQLAHTYLSGRNIIVDKERWNKITVDKQD